MTSDKAYPFIHDLSLQNKDISIEYNFYVSNLYLATIVILACLPYGKEMFQPPPTVNVHILICIIT